MSWYDQAIAAWYRSKENSASALGAGISQAGHSISGAIQQAGKDRVANQLASQFANSGAYAPRAGMVSPGVNPMTGAPNVASGPAMNPYGVDVLSQGSYGGNTGTSPVNVTGGVEGLNARLAIQNATRQAAGGSAIDIALKNAQIQHYQDTGAAATENAMVNKKLAIANTQKAEQDRNEKSWNTNPAHIDTVPKLTGEIEKTTGKGSSVDWMADFANPYGHRGSIVDGKWVNDPNGTHYALPGKEVDGKWVASPDAGTSGNEIPDGTPQSAIQRIAPIATLDQWKQRSQNIITGGGSYVQPMPGGNVGATKTSGGGGGKVYTDQEARAAVAQGLIKPGDTINTVNGPMRYTGQ